MEKEFSLQSPPSSVALSLFSSCSGSISLKNHSLLLLLWCFKTHEILNPLFLFSCLKFCRNVLCLTVESSWRKKCILGDFSRGSCRAVRMCLYLHVFRACLRSVTLHGGIRYSGVNKQITLICKVGLSWWLMGYPLLQNSVCRKNKTELPMQMTREVVRIQCRTFTLGKLPWWKFCLGKPFPLHSSVWLLTCRSSGIYVIIPWHLHALPRDGIYAIYTTITLGRVEIGKTGSLVKVTNTWDSCLSSSCIPVDTNAAEIQEGQRTHSALWEEGPCVRRHSLTRALWWQDKGGDSSCSSYVRHQIFIKLQYINGFSRWLPNAFLCNLIY